MLDDFACEPMPDGSAERPFTQAYLDECMRKRQVRPGMYGQKTAVECLEACKVAQEKKIQQGVVIRCSQSMGNELRREALMGDLGL
ncbi:hypothetical protein F3I62_18895 [Pseudomonas sp. R-28-1W-6]|uniref:hypothetical protein n=1 Tax=Pseudomonas sp. R-28-1W-6 TaxID=2650101 RepID=UPI00136609E3|nr:hypothetical protein [Pseudomonas sp. R-28-1W-6]MWV14173.1 hypothetical protein [Pseudomonas sp. R-28-1W-6]